MSQGQEGPYHDGELALQDRTRHRDLARTLGKKVTEHLTAETEAILPHLPYLLACVVLDGWPTATILTGSEGFVRSCDWGLEIDLDETAPALIENLSPGGGRIGLLAVDLATRTRFRINGTLDPAVEAGRRRIRVDQCYRNCPQYIHAREAAFDSNAVRTEARTEVSNHVDGRARLIVARADTVFIGSHGGGGDDARFGADMSHRGGNPGFVSVSSDGRTVSFPIMSGTSCLTPSEISPATRDARSLS